MDQNKKIILHIDDDDDIRTIAKISLESLGNYNVISCNGYNDALNQIETKTPDFILIDVMMPEVDGPEALVRLRKNNNLKNIPVAFMTAKIMESEIKKLEELNINGIIKKPFEPANLCSQIDSMINASL